MFCGKVHIYLLVRKSNSKLFNTVNIYWYHTIGNYEHPYIVTIQLLNMNILILLPYKWHLWTSLTVTIKMVTLKSMINSCLGRSRWSLFWCDQACWSNWAVLRACYDVMRSTNWKKGEISHWHFITIRQRAVHNFLL